MLFKIFKILNISSGDIESRDHHDPRLHVRNNRFSHDIFTLQLVHREIAVVRYSKHKLFRLRGVFALLTIYFHSNCYGYVPTWVQQKDIANNRCAAVETLSMSLKLNSMNKMRMTIPRRIRIEWWQQAIFTTDEVGKIRYRRLPCFRAVCQILFADDRSIPTVWVLCKDW